MFTRIKEILKYKHDWQIEKRDVTWYPSDRSCVRPDMKKVKPHQLPPLMVKKPAWRQ
ncbi:hypothetical protein STSP2_02771 [Anaerohalosphaera lusitana]|uniref:Uncharacterized protein n=1 Tax=Anaerohalosphaera lusitana TaxID=1936003 RepID=A0A1U9NPD3_9BACT|nr:hypothetical protein [Anaerohalosphaera lusitana]AQT69578.1 hypothetical protein STSP2_02771 [Anaerohalosphaera lusitana]